VKKETRHGPLTLYPMTPEEALKKIMAALPTSDEKKKIKRKK